MATYKLIQDIEAEDHILGPLTLRQFIFALIAIFLLYINFLVATKGAAFMMVVFLPPALFFAFFALPLGGDQPTEVWALAKVRFFFKPRKRIWNQSGVKEMVTITAPKKVERILTNGLDQGEVNSRLNALANTIDSRGWAIKHVDLGAYPVQLPGASSDRLINIDSIPQEVPAYDAYASDDMLDPTNNPVAQQFEGMINQAAQAHREELIQRLNSPNPTAQPAKPVSWFTNAAQASQPAATTASEAELSGELAARSGQSHSSLKNMHALKPASDDNSKQDTPSQTDTKPPEPVTTPNDPAIMSLANNNDLNVSTLAREAHKALGDDGEVVVSLR